MVFSQIEYFYELIKIVVIIFDIFIFESISLFTLLFVCSHMCNHCDWRMNLKHYSYLLHEDDIL